MQVTLNPLFVAIAEPSTVRVLPAKPHLLLSLAHLFCSSNTSCLQSINYPNQHPHLKALMPLDTSPPCSFFAALATNSRSTSALSSSSSNDPPAAYQTTTAKPGEVVVVSRKSRRGNAEAITENVKQARRTKESRKNSSSQSANGPGTPTALLRVGAVGSGRKVGGIHLARGVADRTDAEVRALIQHGLGDLHLLLGLLDALDEDHC